MRNNQEILMRLLLFAPLAYITWQVVSLRRLLNSRAWTLIVSGFLVFVAFVGVGVFYTIINPVRVAFSFVGYSLIATGFHLLQRDLQRVLQIIPGGRRRSDPPMEYDMSRPNYLMVTAKAAWESKTIIVNIVAALLALADLATKFNLSIVHTVWFPLAMALLNVIMRFFTDQPVALGRGKVKQVKAVQPF